MFIYPAFAAKRYKQNVCETPSQNYGVSLVDIMGSHSFTCHPTHVNIHHLNPCRQRPVLDLPTPIGKVELT